MTDHVDPASTSPEAVLNADGFPTSNLTVLHNTVALLRSEVQRLEEWKAVQQTGLLSMATQLLDTGFTGTGIVDGIKYLKDQIKTREAEVQRLREEKAAEVAACRSQRLEAMEWQSRAEAAEAALQQRERELNEANRRLTAIVEAKK